MKQALGNAVRRTSSPEETRAFGREIGEGLSAGDFLALSGPLGAGKTMFAKGVAEALGIDASAVASPTFVLLRVHRGRIPLYHLDAYRLRSPSELREVGLPDLIDGDGAVLLEWAERVREAVPGGAAWIEFRNLGENEREIRISPEPFSGK
ncbi:MAG: tRNA (adenosine(37)-N6)-threonylcarbamoyltransferase complex ATPase subunit type 1 TsaE [Planctomycetota bacterium]